ncbi:MAG: hypothetical protein AAGF47_10225, partial [Planctomycetota bacterium]
PTDELVQHLGSVLRADGAPRERVIEAYAEALRRHPELSRVRADLARLRLFGGENAASVLDDWRVRLLDDAATDRDRLIAAELFLQAGEPQEARRFFESVDAPKRPAPEDRLLRARVTAQMGEPQAAADLVGTIIDDPRTAAGQARSAVILLAQLGMQDEAERLLKASLAEFPDSAAIALLDANRALSVGDESAAIVRLEAVIHGEARAPGTAWELASIGEQAVRLGVSSQSDAVAELGLEALRRAGELLEGSATLQHDLGMALVASGRADEGLDALDRAVLLAPENRPIRESRDRVAAIVAPSRGD